MFSFVKLIVCINYTACMQSHEAGRRAFNELQMSL